MSVEYQLNLSSNQASGKCCDRYGGDEIGLKTMPIALALIMFLLLYVQ